MQICNYLLALMSLQTCSAINEIAGFQTGFLNTPPFLHGSEKQIVPFQSHWLSQSLLCQATEMNRCKID